MQKRELSVYLKCNFLNNKGDNLPNNLKADFKRVIVK